MPGEEAVGGLTLGAERSRRDRGREDLESQWDDLPWRMRLAHFNNFTIRQRVKPLVGEKGGVRWVQVTGELDRKGAFPAGWRGR